MNLSVWSLLIPLLIVSILVIVSLFFVASPLGELSDSPFECGFESSFFSRIPFSLHFFSVSVVFLVFDLEIVALLPLVTWLTGVTFITLLIFILMLGLIIEWFDGSLDWSL
nr:NADH dehydrogenase subunit 3 [Actornithophilus grandiceps]